MHDIFETLCPTKSHLRSTNVSVLVECMHFGLKLFDIVHNTTPLFGSFIFKALQIILVIHVIISFYINYSL